MAFSGVAHGRRDIRAPPCKGVNRHNIATAKAPIGAGTRPPEFLQGLTGPARACLDLPGLARGQMCGPGPGQGGPRKGRMYC